MRLSGTPLRWTLLAAFGVGAAVPRSAEAQAVRLDAPEKEAPAPPAAPPPPPAPAPPPQVTPPKAVDSPIRYPDGASGEQVVVLELLIAKDGSVGEARAISGAAPFADSAVEQCHTWKFEPATRGGEPVASKIRFEVRFTPPVEEPANPSESEPAPGEPTAGEPAPAPERAFDAPIEVLVIGERTPIRQRLGQADVREMPGAFGDPYRAIESLPGVVPIVSGLPYFYVRGAPPGNVGYFFDGIPVPFLYHFAAGPGVIHPAFVDHVDLYPGAYPARYGRFAGGIVAGEMAPPKYDFRGEASIRLVDSGAMIETPFAHGRGTVMFGGRISYTALVISLIVPEVFVNYWDYQARGRYKLDDDDSVELLLFGSGDFAGEKIDDDDDGDFDRTETAVDVGFHRADLRWERDLSNGKLRSALMFGLDRTTLADTLTVTNTLLGARSEYTRRVDPSFELRLGADVLFEKLGQRIEDESDVASAGPDGSDPGAPPPADVAPAPPPQPMLGPAQDSSSSQEGELNDFPGLGFDQDRVDVSSGVWTEFDVQIDPFVTITPGLRFDLFVSGSEFAIGVDPRIMARFQIAKDLTLVHGLGLVHQAPSFVVPVPGLKPTLQGGLQRAVQHSAGVEYKLPYGISSSFTLFENLFFNMTDAIGIAQLAQTGDNEIRDTRSFGRGYGAEISIRRSLSHDLGGFFSYTLSRSERFQGPLAGPATTDRTHVLNLGASYNLGRNWRAGTRLMLYTGIPATVAYIKAAQNPPRTPAFWRVDVRLQKRWYIRKPDIWWGPVFEVLNTTLNREVLSSSCNAYRCEDEEFGPVTIPSIGFEGAF